MQYIAFILSSHSIPVQFTVSKNTLAHATLRFALGLLKNVLDQPIIAHSFAAPMKRIHFAITHQTKTLMPMFFLACLLCVMPLAAHTQTQQVAAHPCAPNAVLNPNPSSSEKDLHPTIAVRVIDRRTRQPIAFAKIEIWGLDELIQTDQSGTAKLMLPCPDLSKSLIVHAKALEYHSNTLIFTGDAIPKTIDIALHLPSLDISQDDMFMITHNGLDRTAFEQATQITLRGMHGSEAGRKMIWLLQR